MAGFQVEYAYKTMPKYSLFETRLGRWVLTGFALLGAGLSIYRIGSPAPAPLFRGTRLEMYSYGVEAFSLVALAYCFASAPNRLERTFVAFWLCAWAISWFSPLYPASLGISQLFCREERKNADVRFVSLSDPTVFL